MANDNTGALKTPRTTVRRRPDRGAYDFETIASILDEGLVCHIGFVVDGQPYVVPTGYGRDGRTLYLHGSAASRMLRALAGGTPICVTVTLLDGLVLARSAFHHSINYRSVVALGVAQEVEGDEKLHGLRVITEHMARGRWADVRGPTEAELKATSVLKLELTEASAKVRRGPPLDDEEDFAVPAWAGQLPFALVPQPPVPDERLAAGTVLPDYVARYRRPGGRDG
jgi:nitroimidazol reductase NimA-like FMN-containing flavoprotein (pyridoxamine 5'-phosphate oxidase superfamily)